MEDNENIINLEGDSGDDPNLGKTTEEGWSFSSIHVIILGIATGFIRNMFFQGLGDFGTVIDAIAVLLIIIGIFRALKEGV